MPQVRKWWEGLYKDYMALGIDGVWNDMNEPSVFKSESGTMPRGQHPPRVATAFPKTVHVALPQRIRHAHGQSYARRHIESQSR
jgi:alpha-glucosidase (family GH31 glycosyl hydrolase)